MFSSSNFTLKPVKADVCTSLSLVLWHIWISFQRKSFSLCYDAKSLIVESVESLLPNCGLKLVFTCSFSSVQYLIWFFTPFFSFGLLDYLLKRRAANHHLVWGAGTREYLPFWFPMHNLCQEWIIDQSRTDCVSLLSITVLVKPVQVFYAKHPSHKTGYLSLRIKVRCFYFYLTSIMHYRLSFSTFISLQVLQKRRISVWSETKITWSSRKSSFF